MKKLKVTEEIYADSCFSGCRILSDFITVANYLIEKHGDVPVYLDAGYNNISTTLIIEREETDEEYQKRTRINKAVKQVKKERDRKLYEKLKKEFE